MNERLDSILNNPKAVGAVAFLVGSAAGLVGGYFIGKRHNYSYDEYEIPETDVTSYFNVDDEPIALKVVVDADEYQGIVARGELTERGREFVESVGGANADVVIVDEEVTDIVVEIDEGQELVRQSVFATDDDDWNYEEELRNRTPNAPYVLHRDEFFADEMNLTQMTLTYYDGDEILADEDDKPIYNFEKVVGPMRFGHGSGDPNTFYVRNEERHGEYEILKNSSLYSVEVLGMEIEGNERARDLRHFNSPAKFRSD